MEWESRKKKMSEKIKEKSGEEKWRKWHEKIKS